MADTTEILDEDVIRIMVATDNHLGYAEKDAIRGEDSFTAFEEILELALQEDVDMILLGGDLFHDAVPSQNALLKCMQLLRRYTFGDKPVSLEFSSDEKLSFHNAVNQSVNYEDPNLNISIPVFSIHGNHDDPSGFGRLSSLDLLSTTGLVNYFGRWTNLTQVEINPILLRKGASQLALYGLSHIHDARLTRLFENHNVTFTNPAANDDDDAATSDWFHLMVIHQNRADRGPRNYLPEEALPEFLNLVIWGHEHDCRIEPEHNVRRGFYVTQPGSSVPTSLAEGESLKKHVGILEIHKNKFQLKPIPLKTVRPFIFESLDLNNYVDELKLSEIDAAERVQLFAQERIEAMIERAKELESGHPKQPILPLIRLRLVFSNELHMFNAIRFGQTFSERVANPGDVVAFKKQVKRTKTEGISLDKEAMQRAFEKMEFDNNTRVEELVDRYFDEAKERKPLKVLPSKALAEITYRLVERRDANAAENIIKFYKDKAIEHLMETLPNEENIDEQLLTFRTQNKFEDMLKMLDERGIKEEKSSSATTTSSSFSSSRLPLKVESNSSIADTSKSTAASSTRGRGRGRGRATARGGATRSAGHSMQQLDVSVNDSKARTSGRQQTILSSMSASRAARNKKTVYVLSSDDSD